MAYVPCGSLAVALRSCAILNHPWTWAPKRNQVFSANLSSREGPITAKAGRGEMGDLAGTISGDCGFPVCWPVLGSVLYFTEAAPARPERKTAAATGLM